jgi:hypothetical protein
MDRREFLEHALTAAAAISVGGPVLATEKTDKKFVFRAPIWIADKPNGNKRIYPLSVCKKAVENFQIMGQRTLMGHLGMQADSIIHFKDVSHVVTNMFMRDKTVYTDIEVLTTPQGKILEKMLNDGVAVSFRTAGIGNGKMDDNGILTLDDSYRLITVNAVPADEAAAL